MNLILCEPDELDAAGVLRLTDTRAAHVRTVLRADRGDSVRVGVVDGPRGHGEILAIDDREVVLRCALEAPTPPRPAVDLLLALPRPKVLRRLWAQFAALGVGHIVLTNAARVERHYFDTHVLEPSTYRPLLIEGLQQAGDTRLPRVSIHRRFRILVEDDLNDVSSHGLRLVAHPGATRRLLDVAPRPPGGALLALGPEGGWTPFELELLQRHRFEPVSLGARILRTDTACIALVAVLHEVLRTAATGREGPAAPLP
jgi:RsmE family RNA methyltransferase